MENAVKYVIGFFLLALPPALWAGDLEETVDSLVAELHSLEAYSGENLGEIPETTPAQKLIALGTAAVPHLIPYLSDRWIACDALLDEPFYQGSLKIGSFSKEKVPSIEWDGENDLNLMKQMIVEDLGTYVSGDVALQDNRIARTMPPSSRAMGWLLSLMNRRIEQIRRGESPSAE